MNLSRKTPSTFLFSILVFITVFNVSAQTLNLPKTLDSPGHFPEVENTFDVDDSSVVFSYEPTAAVIGSFVSSQEKSFRMGVDYQDYFYIEYVEDNTSIRITPENVSNLSFENIESANKATFRVFVDPFASADVNAAIKNDDVEKLFKKALVTIGTRQGEAGLRKTRISADINKDEVISAFGSRGTSIVFSADELSILGDTDGHTLIMEVSGHDDSPQSINIPANANPQTIFEKIRDAAAVFEIYVNGDVPENNGSLEIYANSDFTINNDPVVGFEEFVNQQVSIYPNPVRNRLYLSYEAQTQVEYILYDLTGKQLSATSESGKTHRIDVSGLSTGSYLLEAKQAGKRKVFSVVKE